MRFSHSEGLSAPLLGSRPRERRTGSRTSFFTLYTGLIAIGSLLAALSGTRTFIRRYRNIRGYNGDIVHPSLQGKSVVKLTEASFDLWLEDHPKTFVAFVVPWCPFSQRLMPAWHTLGEVVARRRDMQENDVAPTVAIVNCDVEKHLCSQRLDVQGFPTMRFYSRTQGRPSDYLGPRNVRAMLRYIYDDQERHVGV